MMKGGELAGGGIPYFLFTLYYYENIFHSFLWEKSIIKTNY